jgi:hypothetical protein
MINYELIFILEINDFCSADDLFNNFQGNFDSLYGYEKKFSLLLKNLFVSSY